MQVWLFLFNAVLEVLARTHKLIKIIKDIEMGKRIKSLCLVKRHQNF